MNLLDITLECVLVVLLGATLLHAIRLERALGILRGERSALGDAVATLESGTRQAESGVEALRTAAENAGRQLARHVERAAALQDDLKFLHARGEGIADRLEELVRTGRPLAALHAAPQGAAARSAAAAGAAESAAPESAPRVRCQAERDLLRALQVAR